MDYDYERDRQVHLFWARVRKSDGCWEWQGAWTGKGYGLVPIGRRGRGPLAHRFSWELHNGPIPADRYVLHKCDNPRCVRPDHLFVGTLKDNMRDASAKGRTAFQQHPEATDSFRGDRHWTRQHPERLPRGADNPATKLTPEQVREIRTRLADGTFPSVLARAYGVSEPAIHAIRDGVTWTHVEGVHEHDWSGWEDGLPRQQRQQRRDCSGCGVVEMRYGWAPCWSVHEWGARVVVDGYVRTRCTRCGRRLGYPAVSPLVAFHAKSA